MARIVVKTDRCKGCGYCVLFCPKQVLAMSDDLNVRGVHYVRVTNNDQCTGCASCCIVCPDVVIEVYK